MRQGYLFTVLLFIVMACASPGTVDDPAETHFIRFYGRDGDQTGRDLVVMPDGSLVLFGTTRPTTPTNGTQWYVTRVDSKGSIIWEVEYGGPDDDEARDIELTSTGVLVLVGNTQAADGLRDVLVKLISAVDGTEIATATHPILSLTFPFPATTADEDAYTITEIYDGFMVAGTTTYVNPANPPNALVADTHDAFIIRLNTDLTARSGWKQVYGKDSDDAFVKVMPAPPGAYTGPDYSDPALDSGFYAFGYSDFNDKLNTVGYDHWVLFIDRDGVPSSKKFYVGTSSAEEKVSSFGFTGSQMVMVGLQTGISTDVYLASAFVPQADTLILQFQRPLGLPLGANLSGRTSVCQAVVNGGFYVLAEENGFNNDQNWILTRLNNNGTNGWQIPIVFGGEGMDSAGAVKELPDGRVVIIGTMRTGRPDAGEYKMTLVKVDGEGKFEK